MIYSMHKTMFLIFSWRGWKLFYSGLNSKASLFKSQYNSNNQNIIMMEAIRPLNVVYFYWSSPNSTIAPQPCRLFPLKHLKCGLILVYIGGEFNIITT